MEGENPTLKRVYAGVLTSTTLRDYQAIRDAEANGDWDRVDFDEVWEMWDRVLTYVDRPNTCNRWTQIQNSASLVHKELYRCQKSLNNFCDVHLIGIDGYVPVHRSFLEVVSPFFKSLIKDNLEATRGTIMTITVMDATTAQLTAIMNMLYLGEVLFDRDDEILTEVKKLLKMFGVTNLDTVVTEEIVNDNHPLHNKRKHTVKSICKTDVQGVLSNTPVTAVNVSNLVTPVNVPSAVTAQQVIQGASNVYNNVVSKQNSDTNQKQSTLTTSNADPILDPSVATSSRAAQSVPSSDKNQNVAPTATPVSLPQESTSRALDTLPSQIPEFTKVPPGTLFKQKQAPRIKRTITPLTISTRTSSRVVPPATERNVSPNANSLQSTSDATPGPSGTIRNSHANENNVTDNTHSSRSYVPSEFTKVPPGSLLPKVQQPRLKRPILNTEQGSSCSQSKDRNLSSSNQSDEDKIEDESENIPKSRYEHDNDFVLSSEEQKSHSEDIDDEDDDIFEADMDTVAEHGCSIMTRAKNKLIESPDKRYSTRRSKLLKLDPNLEKSKGAITEKSEKTNPVDPPGVVLPPTTRIPNQGNVLPPAIAFTPKTSKKPINTIPIVRKKVSKKKRKSPYFRGWKCLFCKRMYSAKQGLTHHLQIVCAKDLKCYFNLNKRHCKNCNKFFMNLNYYKFLEHVDTCVSATLGRREGLRARKPTKKSKPKTIKNVKKPKVNPKDSIRYGDENTSTLKCVKMRRAVIDLNFLSGGNLQQMLENPNSDIVPRPEPREGYNYVFNYTDGPSTLTNRQKTKVFCPFPSKQRDASKALQPGNAATTSDQRRRSSVSLGTLIKTSSASAATTPKGKSNPSAATLPEDSNISQNTGSKAPPATGLICDKNAASSQGTDKSIIVQEPNLPGTSKAGPSAHTKAPVVPKKKGRKRKCWGSNKRTKKPGHVKQPTDKEKAPAIDGDNSGVEEMDVESVSKAVSALFVPQDVVEPAGSSQQTAIVPQNTGGGELSIIRQTIRGLLGDYFCEPPTRTAANVGAVADTRLVQNQSSNIEAGSSAESLVQPVATDESSANVSMDKSSGGQLNSVPADKQLTVTNENIVPGAEMVTDANNECAGETVQNDYLEQNDDSNGSRAQSEPTDEREEDQACVTEGKKRSAEIAGIIKLRMHQPASANETIILPDNIITETPSGQDTATSSMASQPVTESLIASDSTPVSISEPNSLLSTYSNIARDPILIRLKLTSNSSTSGPSYEVKKPKIDALKNKSGTNTSQSDTRVDTSCSTEVAPAPVQTINVQEDLSQKSSLDTTTVSPTPEATSSVAPVTIVSTPHSLPHRFLPPRSNVTAFRPLAFGGVKLPPTPAGMPGRSPQTARRSVNPAAIAQSKNIVTLAVLPQTANPVVPSTNVSPSPPISVPETTIGSNETPKSTDVIPQTANETAIVPVIVSGSSIGRPEPSVSNAAVDLPAASGQTTNSNQRIIVLPVTNSMGEPFVRRHQHTTQAKKGPLGYPIAARMNMNSASSMNNVGWNLPNRPIGFQTNAGVSTPVYAPSYPIVLREDTAFQHTTKASTSPNTQQLLNRYELRLHPGIATGATAHAFRHPTNTGADSRQEGLTIHPQIFPVPSSLLPPPGPQVPSLSGQARVFQNLLSVPMARPPPSEARNRNLRPSARSAPVSPNPFQLNSPRQIACNLVVQSNVQMQGTTASMSARCRPMLMSSPMQQTQPGSCRSTGQQSLSSADNRVSTSSTISQTVSLSQGRRRRSLSPQYRIMSRGEVQSLFEGMIDAEVSGQITEKEVANANTTNIESSPAILVRFPVAANMNPLSAKKLSGDSATNLNTNTTVAVRDDLANVRENLQSAIASGEDDDVSIIFENMPPIASSSASRNDATYPVLPSIKKEKIFQGPKETYIMEYKEGDISCPKCKLQFQSTESLVNHRTDMCF